MLNRAYKGYTFRIAIGTIILTLIFLTIGAMAQGMTWQVTAGGETPDMAVQGMGFFPGVITINAGDSINWTLGGHEDHTIGFLSGAQAPEPGSPDSLLPKGASSYDGTGITSSGLLQPDQVMNYTLNFTKSGVYTYQCLVHPGMGGVVIVQPSGSPYPFTQEQYASMGQKELQADLDTGKKLADNLNLNPSPGADGTTVWQVAADIPLSMNADLVMSPKNNSTVSGNAMLNFIGVGKLQVQVQVSGLAPNSVHPEHIHAGTCAAGGPITIPLNDLTAGPDGKASSTTIISGPPWFTIPNRGWFINVHRGPTMSDGEATPISCGDAVKQGAAYMRFKAQNLTIHAGDQVVWTQMNFMAIHTVSFLASGQTIPDFILPDLSINPVAAAPSGGSSYNGTGFYNSGVLQPGQNYSLTFTKQGTYDYWCLIHDEMKMVGEVVVLPPPVKTPGVSVLLVAAVIGMMALFLRKRGR
jgi:plastocyanin